MCALHASGDGESSVRSTRRHAWALIVLLMLVPVSRLPGQVSTPQRVRVSQGVAVGLLVKKVDPEYPKELKKKRIQGMVTLKILISKEGDVSKVEPVSGHPELAPLAIDAVKQWKYKPYLLQGEPVMAETTVQVNFTLAND